jgi:predicted  nucleic acid-binding Zn-ribbon protein
MPLFDDLHALLAVQETDTKILRAQAAIAALDTGSALAAAYNTGKAEAERLSKEAVHAQAEQRDAELRLAGIETKEAHEKKRLFSGTVHSPRDLENLQKEVEMLHRQKGDGETLVLEAMEAAGERTKAAEQAEAELAALADRYRVVRAAYKERHAALTKELGAGSAERAERVRSVPAALLTRYDAIRAKRNGIGAAEMDANDGCGACHTRLSSTLVDAVLAARTVEVCEHCGRILVPMHLPTHE